MRNFRLEIEYDGSRYCGWQAQNSPQSTVHSPQKKSIQEVLEKTLSKILREKIHLMASGRTDAGVHAFAQVANFKTTSGIAALKLQRALNSLLPQDIVIRAIEEKPLGFHSRFQAKSKEYRYYILHDSSRCAFLKEKVYFLPYPLKVKLMQEEARALIGRHDFKSFCASGSSVKDTARNVRKVSLKKIKCNFCLKHCCLLVLDITADGFLYNMVRSIVGTLIQIGRGKLGRGSMKKILSLRDRRQAGPTAPPRGLYLLQVNY